MNVYAVYSSQNSYDKDLVEVSCCHVGNQGR